MAEKIKANPESIVETIDEFGNHIKFELIDVIEYKEKEYALLLRTFGKGESAGMAYCKFNHDVLGSSNLRDIKEYCQNNGITYLTTLDFLYYALKRNKLTEQECNQFIKEVRSKGSKLPDIDIANYNCQVQI